VLGVLESMGSKSVSRGPDGWKKKISGLVVVVAGDNGADAVGVYAWGAEVVVCCVDGFCVGAGLYHC